MIPRIKATNEVDQGGTAISSKCQIEQNPNLI